MMRDGAVSDIWADRVSDVMLPIRGQERTMMKGLRLRGEERAEVEMVLGRTVPLVFPLLMIS